jgi:O-antigen/teichoic acid export membrane protein
VANALFARGVAATIPRVSVASPPGQLVARNAVLNAAGQGLQLLAALAVVPFLVRGLGSEAFGAFQLIWVVLGYLALMDIGLGRATTRFVADALGRDATREIPEIVWTAATIQVLMGLLGAALLFAVSAPLTRQVLDVPASLEPEVVASLRWMAVALPAVLLSASFSGVLEAHQRFDVVNAVRIPSGLATLIAPLIALAMGAGLAGMVCGVVIVRYLTVGAYAFACRRVLPVLRGLHRPSVQRVRILLGFGGWVTVSNLVSPLMVYLDRFVIGARLGLRAVAHYTAPFDAITRAAIVPSSLAQALFPAFSALHASADRDRASRIAAGGVRVLATTIGALVVAVIIGAHAGLGIWLGPSFADAGALPLRILAIGVLANARAQIPYALLQGAGRADLTATFHLAELPAYALLLWLLTARYGITGAAIAWSVRCSADAGLLFLAMRRLLGASLPLLRPLLMGAVLPITLATAVAWTGLEGASALTAALAGAAGAATLGWHVVLQADERRTALRLTLRPTNFPGA